MQTKQPGATTSLVANDPRVIGEGRARRARTAGETAGAAQADLCAAITAAVAVADGTAAGALWPESQVTEPNEVEVDATAFAAELADKDPIASSRHRRACSPRAASRSTSSVRRCAMCSA